MDNTAELNRLYAERDSLKRTKSTLEDKISRLRAARKQVDYIEKDVRKLKKSAQDEKEIGSKEWTGSNRDQHIQFLSSSLDLDYQTYIQNIQSLSDSISDEIRRLDSELFDTVGLLDWVWSKISSLF